MRPTTSTVAQTASDRRWPVRVFAVLLGLAAAVATGSPAQASSAVFKLVNPGPGSVSACSTITLEVRATFDTVIVATRFA
jgi:hypothetical protein